LLNSPYFDDLAGTDSKSLYDEVVKKGIPFHKVGHLNNFLLI